MTDRSETTNVTADETPRVAVQCLASYNAGRLIFEWVDATDVEEMQAAQERVAKRAVEAAKEAKEYPVYFGDPEEFMIADYDGFGEAASHALGEWSDYDKIARIAKVIDEHGDAGRAFFEFASDVGMDLDEIEPDDFDRHYRGEWDSEQAYVQEQAEELGVGGLPGRVWTSPNARFEDGVSTIDALGYSYVDWDVVVREMFKHGNYSYVSGYVFESEV